MYYFVDHSGIEMPNKLLSLSLYRLWYLRSEVKLWIGTLQEFATNCEGLAHDDTDGGAPGAVRLGRATPHHKPGQRCTFGPTSDKSKFYEDFT